MLVVGIVFLGQLIHPLKIITTFFFWTTTTVSALRPCFVAPFLFVFATTALVASVKRTVGVVGGFGNHQFRCFLAFAMGRRGRLARRGLGADLQHRFPQFMAEGIQRRLNFIHHQLNETMGIGIDVQERIGDKYTGGGGRGGAGGGLACSFVTVGNGGGGGGAVGPQTCGGRHDAKLTVLTGTG